MRKFEFTYKIDEGNKVVVALSSFAGKTITGVARCAPEDTFDIDKGKKLAAARCNLKIAEKRMKYAEKCAGRAAKSLEYWVAEKEKAAKYEADSANAYVTAVNALIDLENTL